MLESFLGRILRFEWEGKSLQGRLLEYSRDYLLFEQVEADIAFQLDLPLIGKFIEGPLGIHLCRNKTTLQARNQGTKELTLSHAGAAKILKPFEAFSNPSEALVSFACQETAPLLSLSLHGIFTLLLPRAKATPREALSPDQQLRFRTTSAEIEEEIEAQEAVNAAEQKEASLKDEKE